MSYNYVSNLFLICVQICISSICQTECISPLKHAMQLRKDMIAVACETLNRLFSTNEDRLVKQVRENLYDSNISHSKLLM